MSSQVSDSNHMPDAPNGWVLYDGACGFCTGGIAKVKPMLEHYGFVCNPLQSDWVTKLVAEKKIELLDGMKYLTPEMALYVGIDAYANIAKRIWWGQPFYWLCLVPPIKWLLKCAYEPIARNRYKLAGQCQLPKP